MKKALFLIIALAVACSAAGADRTLVNNGWRFALGDASSMRSDFTHGTEYFSYVCKVASNSGKRVPPPRASTTPSGRR